MKGTEVNNMETIRSQPNHLGLFCFLGLNIADSVITWQSLSMGASELNWYKFLLSAMPVWSVLVLKMIIVGLVAFLVCRYRKSLLNPLNVGMSLVVAFNLLPIIIVRVLR